MSKIMKALEEELAIKVEKIRVLESKATNNDNEKQRLESVIKDMKKTIERVSKGKAVQ